MVDYIFIAKKQPTKDENECADLNGGCHQTCNNTDGGFFCSCNQGYDLQPDNITCIGWLIMSQNQ